jgi:hypothetical protein
MSKEGITATLKIMVDIMKQSKQSSRARAFSNATETMQWVGLSLMNQKRWDELCSNEETTNTRKVWGGE